MTQTFAQNIALLPSYGLEEVHLLLKPKVTKSSIFLGKPFKKSLIGQIFLVILSNPNKTASNAVRGGENI